MKKRNIVILFLTMGILFVGCNNIEQNKAKESEQLVTEIVENETEDTELEALGETPLLSLGEDEENEETTSEKKPTQDNTQTSETKPSGNQTSDKTEDKQEESTQNQTGNSSEDKTPEIILPPAEDDITEDDDKVTDSTEDIEDTEDSTENSTEISTEEESDEAIELPFVPVTP